MNAKGKLGIVAVLVIAVAAVLALKYWDRTDEGQPPGPTETRPAGPLPTLVDLGKGKCLQCKNMTPVLNGLQKDYAGRLAVETIDLTKDPDAAEMYRVRLIPLQVFLAADGRELWRHEGFMSREDILAKWKELGVDLDAPPAETEEP